MIRTDPLTGLAERGTLDQFLQEMARKVDRYGIPITCALVDLDDFKEVNDIHGHLEGDRVLQAWGRFVRKRLKDGIHAIRLGGDEFVLLYENRRRAAVRRALEGWIQTLRRTGLAGYSVGMSVGVAGIPEDTTDVYELLPLADQALYLAKARGKGTVAYPDVGRVRLEWPPLYVPRPMEQRTFRTLLRERSLVVVKGPRGAGKTRMVREVLGRKAVLWDPERETRPGLSDQVGVVKDVDRLTFAGWGRIGRVLQEEGRCVLIVSEEEAQVLEARLQPLFGKHRVGEIRIPPMDTASFRRLLERALGGMVPPGLEGDLRALSGGLPGLAGLLLQSFVEEGWLSRERTHWSYWGVPPYPRPSTLRPLWEERSQGIGKRERMLLGLLGLAGGRLRADLLMSLARETGESHVDEALADLEEGGWIRGVRGDQGEEILLRETLWGGFAVEGLDPDVRKHAASWLLEHGKRDLPEKFSLTLLSFVDPDRYAKVFLYALQEAVNRLDIRRIGNLLLWVPQALRDHSAVQEARLWFLRSTGKIQRLLEEMPDPPPPHLRWMVLDALGDLGKLEEALKLAQQWEHEMGEENLPELRAAVASLILIAGENRDAEEILRVLRKQSLSPFVRARVEYGLGEFARLQGHDVQAIRHYRRALRALEQTAYVRGQALLLLMQAEVLVQRGWLKEATRIYEQVLPRSRDAHALDVEGYGNHMLGEVLLERGYIARAQRMLREARRLLQVAGVRRFLPFVLDDLAFLSLLVGDWASAQGYLHLFTRLSSEILSEEYQLHTDVLNIWLSALKEGADVPGVQIRGIARRVSSRGFRRLAYATILWGDENILQSLNREGKRHTVGEVRMVRSLMEGMLYAGEGDREKTSRAFRRARHYLAHAGSPLWHALLFVARGRAYKFLGDTVRADRVLQEAFELFQRLQLSPLADQVSRIRKAG